MHRNTRIIAVNPFTVTSFTRPGHIGLCLALLLAWGVVPVCAADWPQFRGDSAHTALSREELSPELHLAWIREQPPLKPAWPDQSLLKFDCAYEPVVAGETAFVGSPLTDSVSAWDLKTGAERWHYFTNGPVRFPPLVWQDRVFAVSDDGYLYCLATADGKLLWKFRGGLDERRILGNERLISMWPARGAPVVVDNTIYFAASIWPFMGIFIHALDARTGEVRWTNDGDGSIYIKQPHMTDSFAGVAPQGVFAAVGERLLIPGGRSVPACYDRRTGKLLHFLLGENSKKGGGSTVAASDQFFVSGGGVFANDTGKHLGALAPALKATQSGTSALTSAEAAVPPPPVEQLVIDGDTITGLNDGKLYVWRVVTEDEKIGPRAKQIQSLGLPGAASVIQAGSRLYIGAPKRLMALAPPQEGDKEPRILWQKTIEGTPASLVAANGRLLVSTLQGRVYCFSGEKSEPQQHRGALPQPTISQEKNPWTERAMSLLETTEIRAGYALAWGWGSGNLVRELARLSQLNILVVEPNAETACAAREALIAEGWYGRRISVLNADPQDARLPSYFASLMVTENLEQAVKDADATFLQQAFASLRPFGGAFWIPAVDGVQRTELGTLLKTAGLPRGAVGPAPAGLMLTRLGPLPGAADWTHEHADAANTRVSHDKLVKAPLGLLWFGGTSNEGTLPRHGHGPQPQVCQGRMFIEGVDNLRAIDIYTGRLLWETKLPGVGSVYDNLAHQAGANASGTNFISTPEGIYVVLNSRCLQIANESGKTIREFTLPPLAGDKPPRWGYLNISGDYLIAGSDPIFDADLDKQARGLSKTWKLGENDNLSSSKQLVVLDRRTGAVLWKADAKAGFRHNGICIGGGRLYALDRYSGAQQLRQSLAAQAIASRPRLVAFDLKTGKELWSSTKEIFGTWLSYSAQFDVLVEAGRLARDTLFDEPKGMRAWQAGAGKSLWFNSAYSGPAMIHGDLIFKEQNACDLLTGMPRMRLDPLTGQRTEWSWTRTYGCNTPMASEHLLTFRSGAAGYCDLTGDGGTSNLGGFRSSCTNNLVVAGGVLCAPDYTRTCTCSYQNQTSLALVHMPGVETWTSFGKLEIKPPLRRVGVNLGAAGDRKAEDGTLWLEAPSVGGVSPTLDVKVTGANLRWFRRHEGQFGGPLPWVASSGVIGVEKIELKLPPPKPAASDKNAKAVPIGERLYTLKLYFSEPENIEAGQRVFDVHVQGQPVISGLDVVKSAGGPRKSLVREIKDVRIGELLTIELAAPNSSLPPLLCGWHLQAEGW